MKLPLIERRVLVILKKDISKDTLQNYFIGLEKLKFIATGLIHFEIHELIKTESESHLNNAVRNVLFPDIMTVWKFNNEISLNEFLTSKDHMEIAEKYFKPAVEQRIVFNSKIPTHTSSKAGLGSAENCGA